MTKIHQFMQRGKQQSVYDPTVRTVPRLGLLEMLLTFLRRLVWRLWYVVAGVVLVVLTALTAPTACLMPTLKTHLKDFRQLLLTDTSEI